MDKGDLEWYEAQLSLSPQDAIRNIDRLIQLQNQIVTWKKANSIAVLEREEWSLRYIAAISILKNHPSLEAEINTQESDSDYNSTEEDIKSEHKILLKNFTDSPDFDIKARNGTITEEFLHYENLKKFYKY